MKNKDQKGFDKPNSPIDDSSCDIRTKSDTRTFYVGEGKRVRINDYLLREFLTIEGFSQYQGSDSRVSRKDIIYNNDRVLEIHNASSVKTWLRNYFEDIDEIEFEDGKLWGGKDEEGYDKYLILSMIQNYSISKLDSVLTQLDVYSSGSYKDTIPLDLFNDTEGVAHIRFKNGVVRVTKNDIEIIPYSSVKDDGAVWEESIIERDVEFDDGKGCFEEFCQKAFHFKNPNKKSDVWMNNYDLNEEQYLSMKTGYGYLLHTYNDPSIPKCVYFIDSDSELGKPEGGNGKSLVMGSISEFKSTTPIDGMYFRKSSDSGGQFQFSSVTPDTTFIMIDEIKPEFRFDDLFSKLSGNMEIEKKNKNKTIIPKKDKPKFGLTTNYVISGVGTSNTRRQHIVEFGNYWKNANDLEESPCDKKHIGKRLFESDFSDKDWNQFYTYGFKCLQEYFQKGLIESKNQSHMNKRIKMEIEGANGDGSVTDWMSNWCENERMKNNYHIDGIEESKLYEKFNIQNVYVDRNIWDSKKFRQSFFKFIDLKPEYEYNPQFANRGKTLTKRRWLKGGAGNQVAWIKITDVKI